MPFKIDSKSKNNPTFAHLYILEHGIRMQITPKFLNKKQKIDNLCKEISELILIRFKGDEHKLLQAIEKEGPFSILKDANFHREIYNCIINNFKDPLTPQPAAERAAVDVLMNMGHLQDQYKLDLGVESIPVDQYALTAKKNERDSFKNWLASCYIAISLCNSFSSRVDHKVFAMIKKDSKIPLNTYRLKQIGFVVWAKLSFIMLITALITCLLIPELPLTFGGPLISIPVDLLDKSFVDVALARQNSLIFAVATMIITSVTVLFMRGELWSFLTKKNNSPLMISTLSSLFDAAIIFILFFGVFLKGNLHLQNDFDRLVQKESYEEAVELAVAQPEISEIKVDYILAQIYAAQFEKTKREDSLAATQKHASKILSEINYYWMQKDAIERISQSSLRPFDKSFTDPIYYKFWWTFIFILIFIGRINLLFQQIHFKKKPE